MKLQHRMFAIIVTLMMPVAAHAVPIPVTYVITGPAYAATTTSGVPTGVAHGTVTVVVDELGANYDGAAPLLDYIFSDGHTTISSADADYAVDISNFITDATGALLRAYLRVRSSPFNTVAAPVLLGSNFEQSVIYDPVGTGQSEFATFYCSSNRASGQCNSQSVASYVGLGATLAVSYSAVSEPSQLALISIGILGVIVQRRRGGVSARRL